MKSSRAGSAEAPTEAFALSELRHLILATQREGHRALAEALRPHGLTPSQAEILAVLAESDGLTLVELGRSIVCETGSPSRLVDHLVRAGLVERQAGVQDRRVVHLQLTPHGRALMPLIGEAEALLNALICRQLPAPERVALAGSLRALLEGSASGAVLERRFRSAPVGA